MGTVRAITNNVHFHAELSNAGSKLVVVCFTSTSCGACQRFAAVFEQLATKYHRAVFLKVDVDQCSDTATAHGIQAMPTFMFYRNKILILDNVVGANARIVENKIQQYYGSENGDEGDSIAGGHIDLVSFIHKTQCESLNEADEHPLADCLSSGPGYLESDCDAQLIINLSFTQAVKVHSLKIEAPQDKGPKTIKIFINQPHTLDFDQADSNQPVQELQLSPSDVEGNPVNLRFVKFQNVQNMQLFVKDNLENTNTTQIDHLTLFGSPITTTNMGDFKRVAGKKGECH
ncbi:hypothetical protein R5R35_006802 [Gryllus longicercus]|uniref:Thioredoxin-like protein 1 n=1 Tax=Gryllus longicercus TaxID=2509291 RepID=A0AAN9VGH6_9ORTH